MATHNLHARAASAFGGALFTSDFLTSGITGLEEWSAFDDSALDSFEDDLRRILSRFPYEGSPNEPQTESDLIWPFLERLGWTAHLPQQNLSAHGRRDVPDGLLFENEEKKAQANALPGEWRSYELGLAVVESKRWERPLDRRSRLAGEETAPSTQMLRYLRRVDDLTNGALRWGILTNGARWRLYFSGARSVSEQFFEADLARILNLPGHNEDVFALDEAARRHCLRVFALMFRREAFLPGAEDARTFHRRAMDEGRRYEERVAGDISELIFEEIFPLLVAALADAAPDAEMEEAREAALVVLYRLLFILYAEDRGLLPAHDARYDDYGLRNKVRDDVGRRMEESDAFSTSANRYWSAFDDLCRLIDEGDSSIGLPPYNGGLFNRERTPLLERVRLPDEVMAGVIDAFSFEKTPQGRRYVNYRDLGVQQLGSIYERLLEQEVVRVGGEVAVRPNAFARKGSGSYYTPDDLVALIVKEAVGPLVEARMEAFREQAEGSAAPGGEEAAELASLDPAERILDLKVCDPSMGSGHFLVNLVDYLADSVIEAMAEAEASVEAYVSPLTNRIEQIRATIRANAEAGGWRVDDEQLDDRRIVRRMVLKRCVHGVDKNPMAVELAKVSLWLHTFTVGAPLGFLDHHLRCGDSLFGSWVREGLDGAQKRGNSLFLHEFIEQAREAASPMREVERLTDAEIAEAQESAERFAQVEGMTRPLSTFLSLLRALDWLKPKDKEEREALHDFFNGSFGNPVDIAQGAPPQQKKNVSCLAALLEKARALMEEERFLHWEAAFPGVWTDWKSVEHRGGFDAVIGNPPWERVKLQQVEWFVARRPKIAKAPRAADRKRMIADLEKAQDPLAREFAEASERAKAAAETARTCGNYPLLSRGDVNLYSLFVERAMSLVKQTGAVGLLVPSGIASDKTAAAFFKSVATEGRLKTLYDFENKKVFFPDVHASFKFCVFVASPSPTWDSARCAFFLHALDELNDEERCFALRAEDFARVNPNTGTAPIFRTRRDAELTASIYERLPVLVDRSSGEEVKAWPVEYSTMFHMTNDSHLFRTREELMNQEGAWPTGNNRYDSPSGAWVPLYEGKMVQAFDHRAARVVVNLENPHRPAQSVPATLVQLQDQKWLPDPQFWVSENETSFPGIPYLLAFKDVTAPTNVRSMIAALVPSVGVGNTLPVVSIESQHQVNAALLLANFNAMLFDYVARQKVQGQHLNWYIVEQLPVVPPETYETTRFGPKTAGEIVREAVLELTYTAHDMAPFARDVGCVDESGSVLPPFVWNEERRLHLRAKLDAVFFHLYGVVDPDDVAYVYSTFPIVEREEVKAHGRYLSRDLCLGWMNALAAGRPDTEVDA